MGVLLAAILRALAAIDAGLSASSQVTFVWPGMTSSLAAERWDPERMDHVRALQCEAHRLSDRNVDLVGGREVC